MSLPVVIHDEHYPEFIEWTADDQNLDPDAVSTVMDMVTKPGKYERDFREWMEWRGECDYERRVGA